jgi:hypothetical protein
MVHSEQEGCSWDGFGSRYLVRILSFVRGNLTGDRLETELES